MLYFSSTLKKPEYTRDANALFSTLELHGEAFCLFDGGKDVWARDYMPVRNHKGDFLSFRYEPSYLKDCPEKRTDYRTDLRLSFPVHYSSINLDGGNVVFSPSREKAIISDRVFTENPEWDRKNLEAKLAGLLDASVYFIESLPSDMTGHADGMVRFLSEDTVLINHTSYKHGLEQRQADALKEMGFNVIEFPFFWSGSSSAAGSYLNYLETARHIFLPVFDLPTDTSALEMASKLFRKEVIPVPLCEIPGEGGALNCISWEDGTD